MKLFYALLSVIIFTGCATMFNNSDSIFLQTSDSKPAAATVDAGKGTMLVTLPMTMPVANSSKPIFINVQETETTQSSVYEVNSHLSGWFWLNILWCFACPLSTTTDMASGDMWSYDDVAVVPVSRKQ
jgi:hypothetical protein